jgi:hypothetical protein
MFQVQMSCHGSAISMLLNNIFNVIYLTLGLPVSLVSNVFAFKKFILSILYSPYLLGPIHILCF